MTLSPDTTPRKEQQLALRAAFVKGWENWMANCNPHVFAAKAFPLPKIVRPRVVTDASRTEWSVQGDPSQCRVLWRRQRSTNPWTLLAVVAGRDDSSMYLSVERARIIADLLANPTELVDDDGGDQ